MRRDVAHMNPAFEKKILLDVVDQMKDPEATNRKQAILRRATFGVGAAGLLVAFFLAINELAAPMVIAFLAAMGGSATGFGLFLDFAQKQWPVTRKHIDMNSVRRRLDELGS